MKFATLIALIATANAAAGDDWTVCTGNSACTTAGSKCCDATQAGAAAAKVCAPSATTVVPNGIVTYGGYTVACSAVAAEAQGANRLFSGIAVVLGAVYMLA